MVVIPHTVVLVAALLAVLGLPCAVAVVVRAERSAPRRAWVRQGRLHLAALRRLDHALRDADLPEAGSTPSWERPRVPPAPKQAPPRERAPRPDGQAREQGRSPRGQGPRPDGPARPSREQARPPREQARPPREQARPPREQARPPREQAWPSLLQVQAELRRLDAQRRGGPTGESRLWTAAVETAYDHWLELACRYLSVTAHLPATGDDLDRDLERLRVEEKLAAAGLRIRPARRPPR